MQQKWNLVHLTLKSDIWWQHFTYRPKQLRNRAQKLRISHFPDRRCVPRT